MTFEETAETLGEMRFTASPEDNEAHGRDLFARAVALEFGPVLESSPEVLEQAALRTRSRLNAAASSTIVALQGALATLQDALRLDLATPAEAATLPLKQAELDAWCAYRVYLSRLDTQPGFPAVVDWPTAPAVPFVTVAESAPV
ncbi:tail fiber assembly protein [Pseudomonas silesiensis]